MALASFIEPESGRISDDHPAFALVEALVATCPNQPESLLGCLRAHQMAPAAVHRVIERYAPSTATSDAWRSAVAANRAKADRLRRALALTEAALGPFSGQVALPPATLGQLWSSDVDVLVLETSLGQVESALRVSGFVDVNPLLARLGRVTRGVRRYGAVDGSDVLASVELCLRLCDDGPPASRAIRDASRTSDRGLPRLALADTFRRRAAKVAALRRPTLRAALELLALLESAGEPPSGRAVSLALHRCAALERALTGPGPLTAAAGARPLLNAPWLRARAHGLRREARRRAAPRRLCVGFSGIDGAGKSTQATALVTALERVSIPGTVAWTRLGYGESPTLSRMARLGQRVLPAGSHSAQRARATGATGASPVTRRGVIGWSWALAVTITYVRRARSALRRARGQVAVLDRSMVDALVGLEEEFGGAMRLGVHRWLIRRFGPQADVTFYLRVPVSIAQTRKDDMFAAQVLEQHARRYEDLLPSLDRVITLDAQRLEAELSLDVVRRLSESVAGEHRA